MKLYNHIISGLDMFLYRGFQFILPLWLNAVVVETASIIRRVNVSQPMTPCQEGTFYSKRLETCIPCSVCDDYSTLVQACTETSDTVCKRCADSGSMDYLDPECKQCPPCEAGYYMTSPCTNESGPVCVKCPRGSFNANPSYLTDCLPCTGCRHKEKLAGCTSTSDHVCGKCKKGFYRDRSLNRCHKCRSCYPGQTKIKECKGGAKGKLCGLFTVVRTDYVNLYFTDSPSNRKVNLSTPAPGDTNNTFKYQQQKRSYDYFHLSSLLIRIILLAFAITALFVIFIYAGCVCEPWKNSSAPHQKNQSMTFEKVQNSTNIKSEDEIRSEQKHKSSSIFSDVSLCIYRERCRGVKSAHLKRVTNPCFDNILHLCQKWLSVVFSPCKMVLKKVTGKANSLECLDPTMDREVHKLDYHHLDGHTVVPCF